MAIRRAHGNLMDLFFWIVSILLAAVVFRAVLTRKERAPDPSQLMQHAPQAGDAEVHALISQGRKIEAIKAYRALHRVDLREAKEAVEKIEREAGHPR
jgi:ribosomal protein L7/L12